MSLGCIQQILSVHIQSCRKVQQMPLATQQMAMWSSCPCVSYSDQEAVWRCYPEPPTARYHHPPVLCISATCPHHHLLPEAFQATFRLYVLLSAGLHQAHPHTMYCTSRATVACFLLSLMLMAGGFPQLLLPLLQHLHCPGYTALHSTSDHRTCQATHATLQAVTCVCTSPSIGGQCMLPAGLRLLQGTTMHPCGAVGQTQVHDCLCHAMTSTCDQSLLQQPRKDGQHHPPPTRHACSCHSQGVARAAP
jgi:hypothetical protein